MSMPDSVKALSKGDMWSKLASVRAKYGEAIVSANSPVSAGNVLDSFAAVAGGGSAGVLAAIGESVDERIPTALLPALSGFGILGAGVGIGSDTAAKFAAGQLAYANGEMMRKGTLYIIDMVRSRMSNKTSV